MRDEELARIPTVDRFETDIEDWEAALENARNLVDLAELGDGEAFTSARRHITGVLEQIQQARHFIAVKRAFLQSFAPADVETLFLDDRSVRQIDVLEASRRSQGGDTTG